jgi:hypothetical protein
MKKLILAFALFTILPPPPFALAWGGSYRSAIDQKWKAVQAWQEQENSRFKAIEREAAKSGAILRHDVPDVIPGNPISPNRVHYRTAP